MTRCGECNGYPIKASSGLRRTFKVCQCPSSIKQSEPRTLTQQVQDLLPHIPPSERIPFLAGLRFAEGYIEYGDGMAGITDERLEFEKQCEQADVYVFVAEQSRRLDQSDE